MKTTTTAKATEPATRTGSDWPSRHLLRPASAAPTTIKPVSSVAHTAAGHQHSLANDIGVSWVSPERLCCGALQIRALNQK